MRLSSICWRNEANEQTKRKANHNDHAENTRDENRSSQILIHIPTRNRIADPYRGLVLALLALVALISDGVLAAEVADVPVFKENARVLFQGDSITDGNRGRNE
jgi:hypothetical protein